jgi:hypothetical protein
MWKLGINNPIPEALRDGQVLRDFLKKYSILPYYGDNETSSHVMLQLIHDLTSLSFSHATCKRDLKFFTFPKNVEFIEADAINATEYDEEAVLDRKAKKEYKEYLKKLGIDMRGFINNIQQIDDDVRDSGNGYLKIQLYKEQAKWSVKFEIIPYRQAAYLATKRGEPKTIIHSEYWTEDWFRTKRPRTYPVSHLEGDFNWKTRLGGDIMETVVHFRSDVDESSVYGRPAILPALYWMYVEHSMASLAVKIAGTEFTAAHILAVEEEDPARSRSRRKKSQSASDTGGPKAQDKSDFAKRIEGLRILSTNAGDVGEAQALVGYKYAHGTKPPTLISLQTNRDVNYNNFLLNTSSGIIYSLNGWDRQLTNIVPIKTNIGGNVLIDLFTIKNIATVMPRQLEWSNNIAKIFEEIGAVVDPKKEFHTVMFPNTIDALILRLTKINESRNALKQSINGETEAATADSSASDGGIGTGGEGGPDTNSKDGDGDGKINE